MQFLIPLVALACVALNGACAFADVVQMAEPATGLPVIGITGEIKKADVDSVSKMLPSLETTAHKLAVGPAVAPLISVDLDSLGGDVMAAQDIGRLVRSHFLFTRVSAGSVCASACVFILIAGVERAVAPGGSVAIRRPFFDPQYFAGLPATAAMQKYNLMLRGVQKYLADTPG